MLESLKEERKRLLIFFVAMLLTLIVSGILIPLAFHENVWMPFLVFFLAYAVMSGVAIYQNTSFFDLLQPLNIVGDGAGCLVFFIALLFMVLALPLGICIICGGPFVLGIKIIKISEQISQLKK